jgi:EAL domain-containing protein (putative c-di-GMP-specific phosphodiesterase class I)
VENQAQFDFLRYQGCDEFQGYLIAKPMPEQEFADLLADSGGQM